MGQLSFPLALLSIEKSTKSPRNIRRHSGGSGGRGIDVVARTVFLLQQHAVWRDWPRQRAVTQKCDASSAHSQAEVRQLAIWVRSIWHPLLHIIQSHNKLKVADNVYCLVWEASKKKLNCLK